MIQDNDTRNWNTRGEDKAERLAAAAGHLDGKLARREAITDILYACIRSGDRVIAEGNNQKQADFLSRALGELDPARVNNLHMIQPSVGRPEHLAVFEKGIAKKLDFAFSGTQSHRIGALMMDGTIEVGAIHTYIELYARLFVDLTPRVVLTAAFKADRQGNLYTGPSTEDTPALVEAAAFSDGIVIAQANEIVDDVSQLERVDIPGSWVDIVVEADRPFYIEPLFTRDPRAITPVQIFMAMMALK
ncbi:MAG: malonate decarboxylase subunit alpha, partial [Salinisphaera sp.]|uniref:malonate decarboxylase subunit alpha n=1 Tax=Salinisphaera sp. TaxID=1914330 RepID=UPI003C7C75B9